MQTFTYTTDAQNICHSHICENANDVIYFDIETTGLSAARSTLYMLGYATIEKDKLVTTLYFNDDGKSEAPMLAAFADVLSSYKHIVSYNGDTFDIPYIKEKCRTHGMQDIFQDLTSVDIYRRIRRYKNLLHLDSMHQSDIEELLGLRRNTFSSGGELIGVYKLYLKTERQDLLEELLIHNRDDIQGLAAITNVLAVARLLKGEFAVESATTNTTHLVIKLNVPTLPCRLNFAHKDVLFNGLGNGLTLHVPYVDATLKYFFSDYKNYFFLPAEDMAIHKSVGAYVDPSHKQKATKDTAFVKKEGRFLRCFDKKSDKAFKERFADKTSYIELTDTFVSNEDEIAQYVSSIIKEIG